MVGHEAERDGRGGAAGRSKRAAATNPAPFEHPLGRARRRGDTFFSSLLGLGAIWGLLDESDLWALPGPRERFCGITEGWACNVIQTGQTLLYSPRFAAAIRRK